MKISYFIIILLLNLAIPRVAEYKLTPNQNKKIRQAKSLYKNGLINESQSIYNELLKETPYLKEAYLPLKEILKKNKEIDELEAISMKYLNSNNNSTQSKINVLDAFIWSENNKWVQISDEIINSKSSKNRDIKLTLNILLNNKKYNQVNKYISQLRLIKTSDFYSYEMAMHFLINMDTDNSINEFLLHLEHNPKKYTMIKNRILSFPEITENTIKTILINHSSNLSKLILADIEFRQKNILESYRLLKDYSKDKNDLINFSQDLMQIEEYQLAQSVIEDILAISKDEIIIKKSIIQLAKIFEKLIINDTYNLPISNRVFENELLDSPYKKINEDKLYFLEKAISIYDSLSITMNDIESTYQLGEIKYTILGDLDDANSIYSMIINNKKYMKSDYYTMAIVRTIDIMISKGNLNFAYEILQSNKQNFDENIYASKEIQILFYKNDWEKLTEKVTVYLKQNDKDKNNYNDILKIATNISLFNEDTYNLNQYAKSQLKIYQNKKFEAIKILTNIIDNRNIEISSKINYEIAYLQLQQGFINDALLTLNNSYNNTAFEESSILLKAEIYDYILNDKVEAINLYLLFLENFPDSIHYDIIRLRLRKLAS